MTSDVRRDRMYACFNLRVYPMNGAEAAGISADVENLKKVAKLPGEGNSGLVHSTPLTLSVSPPRNSEDSYHVNHMVR